MRSSLLSWAVVGGLLTFTASPLSAATIYNNGGPTNDTARCISGPGDCGGSGQWTIFDDFTLSAASTITGITFYADNGAAAQYTNTTFSFYNSSPFSSAPLTQVTVTGTATDAASGFIEVVLTGLSVLLDADTIYWLGITNTTDSTWTAAGTGSLTGSGFLQSDGSTNNFGPFSQDFAFSLQGEQSLAAVPLPATFGMLIGAIAGLFALRLKARSANGEHARSTITGPGAKRSLRRRIAKRIFDWNGWGKLGAESPILGPASPVRGT